MLKRPLNWDVASFCLVIGVGVSTWSVPVYAIEIDDLLQRYEDALERFRVGEYHVRSSDGSKHEFIVDGENILHRIFSSDGLFEQSINDGKITSLNFHPEDSQSALDRGPLSVRGALKPVGRPRIERAIRSVPGTELLGFSRVYISDDILDPDTSHSIPKMLRDMELTIQEDKLGELDAFIMSGKKEAHQIRLWLAPSLGYLTMKFVYRNSAAAPGRLSYFCYEVLEHEMHDGMAVPHLAKWGYKETASSTKDLVSGEEVPLPPIEFEDGIEYSKIDLRPIGDSDLKFATSIPNGTEVRMGDAPHLDFTWQDGEIVPATDETMRALAGQQFLGGPGSPRFWAVVLGVILVSVALCLKIRDMRRVRAG